MGENSSNNDSILKLNVGGTYFSTYKSTLCKYKETMLEAMFSGRHRLTKDADGYYFIDRPSGPFKTILTFLQTGKLCWPENSTKRGVLKEELNYYGLTEVVTSKLDLDSTILSDSLITFLSECGIKSAQLIYRRSRDGNAPAQDFHSLCDDKGPTLSIIKTQQNLIFGGFTERSWNDSCFFYPSPQSWLFAVTYSVPTKFSAKPSAGIFSSPTQGPCFVNYEKERFDLNISLIDESCRINGGFAYNSPSCFGIRPINQNHVIADLEVFQVLEYTHS